MSVPNGLFSLALNTFVKPSTTTSLRITWQWYHSTTLVASLNFRDSQEINICHDSHHHLRQ